jgi:hypothetical protein
MWEGESIEPEVHIIFGLYFVVDVSKDNGCIFEVELFEGIGNGGVGSHLLLGVGSCIFVMEDAKIVILEHAAQLPLWLH